MRDYVFCRRGEGWFVSFEGETRLLKDTKGMHYIRFLLEHAWEGFRPYELLEAVEREVAESSGCPETSPAALRQEGVDDYGFGIDVEAADEETVTAVNEELVRLREREKVAARVRDAALLEDVRQQKAKCDAYLTYVSEKDGRVRIEQPEYKRMRQSVAMNVKRALARIEGEFPALRSHLRALDTGKYYSYHPESPIVWNL